MQGTRTGIPHAEFYGVGTSVGAFRCEWVLAF